MTGTDAPDDAPPPPGAPVADDERLRGIVHLHPAVQTQHEPGKGFALCWREAAAGGGSWWGRLRARLARRHRLELDDLGRRTVELIDGRRSVDDIARALAAAHGLDLDRARGALLLFLTGLMRRNIARVVAAPRASPR